MFTRWMLSGAAAAALFWSTLFVPPLCAAETNKHWAFISPQRPAVPSIGKGAVRSGPRTAGVQPIDAFVQSRLARERIAPSPEADRVTLLRRVSLDLTGLPPTAAEIEAFLTDSDADAYAKVVDRLLDSPHYGERWGRHWLDVARYADSNGYSIDAPRALWKYRDWVIAALNRDQPFDEFSIWQIAGDLLETNRLPAGASPWELQIATGFHRNTQINQEGGIDPEQFRVESVIDRVNTTATAWLGVTLGCAQCHDHKSDPFTQREYYQFFAFFNSTIEDGHGKGAPEGMLEIPGEFEDATKERAETEGDLDRILNTKGSDVLKWEQALTPEQRAGLKPEVARALAVPFAERSARQKRVVYAAFRPEDPEFKTRERKLARLERSGSKPVTTLVMRESDKPRDTHVFIKGDFTRPSTPVTPGVPASLPPLRAAAPDRAPTRLDLARWLVDPNNPLTARVIVNRLWQQYFGHGLVETENDFGRLGAAPSHPELLDWLACELMDPGPGTPGQKSTDARTAWSLKRIHRLMVTSATYRQSSKTRPELVAMDPNNRLLARQNRLRLDAEIVRDVSLAASGLLNPKVGGPSVFPPQPDGVMNLGQSNREWKPSTGPDRHRRGMYTFFWRATPYPALMVFDAADGFSSCTRRVRSNTPLQALTLLNDQAFYECARALAARVLKEGPADEAGRIDYAFRLCTGRTPERAERRRLRALLESEKSGARDEREVSAGPGWTMVARVLLNLDETITRE